MTMRKKVYLAIVIALAVVVIAAAALAATGHSNAGEAGGMYHPVPTEQMRR